MCLSVSLSPSSMTLRSSFVLLLVISTTWLFGLLAVNNSVLAFHYLYTVLCSLQVTAQPLPREAWGAKVLFGASSTPLWGCGGSPQRLRRPSVRLGCEGHVWARGAELRAGTHGAARAILKGCPCSRRAEQENSLQKEVSHPKGDLQPHHHGCSEAPRWGYPHGAAGTCLPLLRHCLPLGHPIPSSCTHSRWPRGSW